MATNRLYYGDNLTILRDYIASASVDLIYLDPPFNSNRSYNVLFKNESGVESDAQITAFEDTWHWNHSAEETYRYLVTRTNDDISKMIAAMRSFIGENQMMAYLVMMTARLIELRRALKPSGSLYLHCDPNASHYLKVILDTIFGPQHFRSEITWKRTHAHSGSERFGPVHDTLLFYTKSDTYTWNAQYTPYSQEYVEAFFRFADPDGRRYRSTILTGTGTRNGSSGQPWRGIDPTKSGRHWAIPSYVRTLFQETSMPDVQSALDALDKMGRILWPAKEGGVPSFKQYLDDMEGVVLQDVWVDIPPLGAQAQERLGYPTQKPLALLERIISASSNPGDVVLDPFCGCGTAIAAAQKLERQWIGIDITHLSIALMKYRLNAMFPGVKYDVIGEPQDVDAARQLAQDNRYQFQWWALSLIEAQPLGGQEGSKVGKKGSDKGIDGVIPFLDDGTGQPRRVIVQVKSGHVKSGDIRDLKGTMQREQAPIGVFITLEEPSADMKTEATTAGFYHSPGWHKDYPALQILTIADLMSGHAQVQMPPDYATFKRAQKVPTAPSAAQPGLFAGGVDDGDAGGDDDTDGDEA